MTRLLTTAEAASVLKFSAETIRLMIARGELKAVRWGRQWRIPEESLIKQQAEPSAENVKKSKRFQDELACASAFFGISRSDS